MEFLPDAALHVLADRDTTVPAAELLQLLLRVLGVRKLVHRVDQVPDSIRNPSTGERVTRGEHLTLTGSHRFCSMSGANLKLLSQHRGQPLGLYDLNLISPSE